MQVTDKMLIAAMKKAVELKIFPKAGLQDDIARNWDAMREVLEAAVGEAEGW